MEQIELYVGHVTFQAWSFPAAIFFPKLLSDFVSMEPITELSGPLLHIRPIRPRLWQQH